MYRFAVLGLTVLMACSVSGRDVANSESERIQDAEVGQVQNADGEPVAQPVVTLKKILGGLDAPVAIAFRPTATPAYVVEQSGRIMSLIQGKWKPFLNIAGRVQSGGERGLLGLAFDPNFGKNRRLYVMYTDAQGDLRVSRFTAYSHRRQANYRTEVVLLDIPHRQYSNHNGGQLAYDPDGFLVIATGDGGGSGGPNGYAQSKSSLLGKLLRIAPNKACGTKKYCVPAKNPFIVNGRRSEILHLGLRNPWRFSYDTNGRLYIADVGQNAKEEISVIADRVRGLNLGWDCREGTSNTVSEFGGSYCAGKSFTPPVYEYGHSAGRCAIVGGVMAGPGSLSGRHLFADFCTGEIFALKFERDSWNATKVADHSNPITSFGRGPDRSAYFVDSSGSFYKIVS